MSRFWILAILCQSSRSTSTLSKSAALSKNAEPQRRCNLEREIPVNLLSVSGSCIAVRDLHVFTDNITVMSPYTTFLQDSRRPLWIRLLCTLQSVAWLDFVARRPPCLSIEYEARCVGGLYSGTRLSPVSSRRSLALLSAFLSSSLPTPPACAPDAEVL